MHPSLLYLWTINCLKMKWNPIEEQGEKECCVQDPLALSGLSTHQIQKPFASELGKPSRVHRCELNPFTSGIQSWDVVTRVHNSSLQKAEAGR